MSELTYENKKGEMVKTSLFLKNRGTCCKTKCLHCPYEFTLEKLGLQFESLTDERIAEAQDIINSNGPAEESITASLLASAFGPTKKKTVLSPSNKQDYRFILIKDQVCGLLKIGKIQATEIYLLKHFQDQGISLSVANCYL